MVAEDAEGASRPSQEVVPGLVAGSPVGFWGGWWSGVLGWSVGRLSRVVAELAEWSGGGLQTTFSEGVERAS